MSKITNDRIQQRIDSALTVTELADILSRLPGNLPIGRIGHFGEIFFLTKRDFHPQTGYVTPNASWREEDRRDIDVLSISVPDIGDEPD